MNMKSKINRSTILLVRVKKNEEHIKTLYEILKKRAINISHRSVPSYSEHIKFVLNHPYRIWYLISLNNEFIGNAYIMKNNCVGIAIIKNINLAIPAVINIISRRHKPLKPIKSIRPGSFFYNVSPDNLEYISTLKNMRARLVQMTFMID
jgi:hypothetical protein